MEQPMPFPANLEALQAAGYVYSHWQVCPECGEGVEVWKTPGKRELAMQPMCELLRPAIRHYIRCKIAPKQEEHDGTQGNQRQGTESTHGRGKGASDAGLQEPARRLCDGGVQEPAHGGLEAHTARNAGDGLPSGVRLGGLNAQGSGIKLYGVRDKNMMAVGWQDGTLVCQFKTAKWSYAGVPEAEAIKLKRSPYAYRIFTTNIKGKYPATKLE